ncbi:MAG: glycosyltransferase family 9 protein, partial [Bacteroidetes bacterium]|nr:glycosyltransferase family 9 protein [Bacteroidota bacterium]
LPDVHVVDRYFEAVKPLKVINDGKGLDYFLPEITGPHLAPNKPYIAFVLGATHNTKRLEPDQMIQICQMIQSPVVLLGGRAESDLGAQIAERCAAKTDLYNLSGKTSLHQSADVIRQASVVLTHDTGLMHIAAAFQRPIILIWGNTTPRLGMYPYDPENKGDCRSFEVQNLPCRPCSKIGHESCPKVHFKCMRLQPLAEIAAQADDLCKNRK